MDTLPARWLLQALSFITILFLFFATVNQIQSLCQKPNILRVLGEGKIATIPDIATLRVGVISEGANPEEVKNINNQKMNQVIGYIKNQKINSQDIKTSDFYITPKYNYSNGQNTIVGYQANQTVTVTVRQINKSRNQLQNILGNITNNGANSIQGINFSFASTDSLKEQARKIAIENAKTKAQSLTNEVGLKLGKPINVIIQSGDYAMPIQTGFSAMQSAKAMPTIEPGSQDVNESVTIEFEVYKK